jgi:hypothetical protein
MKIALRTIVENYFNYFTEIEEHFWRRRGTTLMLSTLDWALVEIWKDNGIPLEAVLRGIDATFDKYDQRPSKTRKVNGLAFCAQEVLAAAEEIKEASVGGAKEPKTNAGFRPADIADFMWKNAGQLESAKLPSRPGFSPQMVAAEVAAVLRRLAGDIESQSLPSHLEDLERRLTVLEEKLFAVLLAVVPDEELIEVRAQADRDLAPYRRKMTGAQIEQLQKQYTHKKLLENYGLPRLSLFYM